MPGAQTGQAELNAHWPDYYAIESLIAITMHPFSGFIPLAFAVYLIALTIAPAIASSADEHDHMSGDSRQVYAGARSPVWLRAVGKLKVPGIKMVEGRRSHHREDCSGTLVASSGSSRADTVITAWHCLEFYNDLSKRITFTLLPGSPEAIELEVYRLADGGSMHADWAILRLRAPIARTTIAAISVHPNEAKQNDNIIMAGYSTDEQLGRHGQILTYDANCNITEHSRGHGGSNCYAHKGASGGAVIFLSNTGDALFSGVISQGNGAGFSSYVPVTGFRNALRIHLQ